MAIRCQTTISKQIICRSIIITGYKESENEKWGGAAKNSMTDHFVPKTPLLKSWFKRDIEQYTVQGRSLSLYDPIIAKGQQRLAFLWVTRSTINEPRSQSPEIISYTAVNKPNTL